MVYPTGIAILLVLSLSACKSSDSKIVLDTIPFYKGAANLNLAAGNERVRNFLDDASERSLDNTIFVLEKRFEQKKGISAQLASDLGKLYMARGAWGKAQRYLAQALGLSKNRAETTRLLAEIALRQQKPRKALYLLEALGGINNKNADFLNTLALTYASLGNDADAVAAWSAALKADPQHAPSAANATLHFLRAERTDLALGFRKTIQGIDNLSFLLEVVAILDANAKNYDDAQESYTAAMTLRATDRLIYNQAALHYKMQNFDTALSAVESLLKKSELSEELRERAGRLKKILVNKTRSEKVAGI